MSGLCGVLLKAEDKGRVGETDVSPMLKAVGGQEGEHDRVVSGRSVCIGVRRRSRDRNSGIVETVVHGHTVILAVLGTLYTGRPSPINGDDSTEGVLRELLARYLQGGIEEIHNLRGDFAAAVWDGRQSELAILTDRFRTQPLFYYEDGNRLVFASRMASLLAASGEGCRSIDPRALVDIMALSTIPSDRTVFNEVRKLAPGYVLTSRQGRTAIRQYWNLNFLSPHQSAKGELQRRLKAELAESVSVRLAADRQESVGAFLSGGIDSSTVTGLLTQLGNAPVKAFSIGFTEQRFNEMEYARIAARHFGAEHHEYYVTAEDTVNAIPVVLEAFDEPFANASAIPTYLCAKVARDHGVDVMYAGDGGDELFAGNERYSSQQIFDYYTRLPEGLREWVVKPAVNALADATGLRLFVLGKKYIRRSSIPLPQRLYSYGLFNVIPMEELFEGDVVKAVGVQWDPYTPLYRHYHDAPASTDLDRQLYIDLKYTISDNDLLKVTRMTQAAGVAVRFPFLDHHLVEFAMSVPAHVKMPGRDLRVFFKEAYSDVLPKSILTKTKHGFGLPIPVWLRTDKRLNDLMRELVLGTATVQRGLFRKRALEDLVERHQEESGSFYGDILWNVMIWELWLRTYWDRKSTI
ncbi:MAG: asparagine synthase (glutamine-hydrolyzing) [Nitrospira sp.]|nr:asparagine synthase (glutamine-hydrolyzing) [Nitrospira sp.]